MSQPPDLEQLSKEERIKLALQAIRKPQELSLRRAAADYNVPRMTRTRRRVGKQSPRNTQPKSLNLKKTEERALAHYKEARRAGVCPNAALYRRYGQPTA